MDLAQLSRLCKGRLIQHRHHSPLRYLLTDSRKLISSPEAVFFALKGARHNGHRFLQEAYAQGVRQFVVQQKEALPNLPEANILQVNDPLAALQQLATDHRSKQPAQVVAITGSNGKTIVKEWLGQLLDENELVVRSPKSYNSQLGVALSLWQMNAQHTLGLFEAGISQPEEMERLAAMLKPDWGIFTNLGSAHDEGFQSRGEKLQEKLKLFTRCKAILYCADQEKVAAAIQERYPDKQLISWTLENQEATYRFSLVNQHGNPTVQWVKNGEVQEQYRLPFSDAASVENLLHCLSFMLAKNYDRSRLQDHLSKLARISMRLEVKAGIHGNYLIDDTYNNDLAGLEVALGFMQQQPMARHRCLILSDMQQTGLPQEELCGRIAELARLAGIKHFIGIGPELSAQQKQFSTLPQSQFFSTTERFLQGRPEIKDSLILIKGARSFAFERIVNSLQQKNHGTVLEINLDALTHNLNFYRSKLSQRTKLMVMVKAFAYGSGSQEVARLLAYQKVDYLAVAYTDEGVSLRRAGIDLPIMVMNPTPESFDSLTAYQLEPEVYSPLLLQQLIRYLKGTEAQCRIHIKFDTGMHRLGFGEEDMPELRQALQQNREQLEVVSLFTHLAGADSEEFSDYSHQQAATFQRQAEYLSAGLDHRPFWHILNSAGILRFPEYHFDMVRLGIGLYGAEVSGLQPNALLPISTLKTTISQIKELPAGVSVGYSRNGKTDRPSRIATIAIGYADGFDRRLSNGKGSVLIRGKEAPVIGHVCMDMTMVDITDIPQAEEGEDVIVFGPERPISLLASQMNTIPYEVLTNISERVKRIFFSA